MTQPIIGKMDRKTHKKCIKCRKARLKMYFGAHDTSSDGHQSICTSCKGTANKKAAKMNPRARLRHHIATRCLDQLGDLAPAELTANLEDYLGYRMSELVDHLRKDLKAREGDNRSLNDALNEGYHIDHIYPLSRYPVIAPRESSQGTAGTAGTVDGPLVTEVNWRVFRECWAMVNLSAIPAAENLAKGAKVSEELASKIPSEITTGDLSGDSGTENISSDSCTEVLQDESPTKKNSGKRNKKQKVKVK